MNIFIAETSVYRTKTLCDEEQKRSQSNCVIFCDNHFTMVLTAPMDTILKDTGVTMNQISVKKRKRLVSMILGLIFVFIFNMLLDIGM